MNFEKVFKKSKMTKFLLIDWQGEPEGLQVNMTCWPSGRMRLELRTGLPLLGTVEQESRLDAVVSELAPVIGNSFSMTVDAIIYKGGGSCWEEHGIEFAHVKCKVDVQNGIVKMSRTRSKEDKAKRAFMNGESFIKE